MRRAATIATSLALLTLMFALPSSACSDSADSVDALGGRGYVIKGDQSAGGIRIGKSTASAVQRLFGRPSSTRNVSVESCAKSWRRLRLEVHFFSFRGDPCARRVALLVTVSGRAAWRTDVGLRVGDTTSRLRQLYPKARMRSGSPGDTGYWLVTRRLCSEAGGNPYPGLLARIRNGKVSALVARLAVCDID